MIDRSAAVICSFTRRLGISQDVSDVQPTRRRNCLRFQGLRDTPVDDDDR